MTDPTKPGPDADRIAELERQIAELEAANEAATGWGAAIGARWERIKGLRAELARLSNEQQPGWDSIVHELGECPTVSSPAPLPGPQDVRDDDEFSRLDNFPLEYQRNYYRSMYKRADEAVEYWKQQAALAQSDAQPVGWRETLDAAIDFIADEYRTREYDDQGEWLPPEARAIHSKLLALRYGKTAPHSPDASAKQEISTMTEEQIKYMVDRFLNWRLPPDFKPDNGISYTRPNYAPSVDATPSGTNLFYAGQAEAMVRHMIEGMPRPDASGLIAEREAIAAEARRYASHYPQSSDGRNTFVLLAEWIESRARAADRSAPRSDKGGA